jgi:hypothetical protein
LPREILGTAENAAVMIVVMAGARQQRQWPSQLRGFLLSHKKFGSLHVFAITLIRFPKYLSKLLQPFEPKIHMTESDFLGITRSGGTLAPQI